MKPKNNTGLRRIYRAAFFSYAGFKATFIKEAAFRQEIILSCVLFVVALCLNVSALEKVALIASLLFVLIVELLNSAIEAVVDRISAEHHILSGQAKDMGSAAVFGALVLAGLVWGGVLVWG